MAEVENFVKEVLKIENEKLIEEFCKVAKVRHVKKGECLISKGTKPRYIMLNFSGGVVRGFYYDKEGKEITDCIQWWIGGPVMPDNNFLVPASVSIDALTDCDVLYIPMEDVIRLQKRFFKDLAILELRLINECFGLHMKLQRVNYQYTAMQRYQWFLTEYPNVSDRINDKYIASYLNMTTVTLSRLKREIREKTGTGNALAQ